MSTYKDETAMATYIAGWGTSAWVAGLVKPVTGNPNIKIQSHYSQPSDYRPQTSPAGYDPRRVPVAEVYGDPGWGE
ncbi:MAG: hypothetical protein K2Y22_14215 [Candidatus Obscuribacterales bacterium]|nr:hypothetical protein [Candidatus Obscuribacterales bacterium]